MTTSADRTTTDSGEETTPTGNGPSPAPTLDQPAASDNDAAQPNSPEAAESRRTSRGTVGRLAQRIVTRFGAATVAFTILATLFGALFAVVTPPFWGHDEITQFGRAYQVAHGGFLPERIKDDRGIAYGGEVPVSITALMGYALNDYTTNPEEPDEMVGDPDGYDRLGGAAVSSATDQVWFTNTAAYSPVPYIPASVGIRLAELFGLNVGGMILLTRLAGLLTYLAVVGVGLWALRKHRVQWLAFTVAALPIAVFQSGTVTADTLTNALAIMVSALLVKALFIGDRLGRIETAALLSATILLPISKPTYVLLAMLIVVIPIHRFGFSRTASDCLQVARNNTASDCLQVARNNTASDCLQVARNSTERGGSWSDAGWRRWIPLGFAAAGGLVFAAWMKVAAPTGDGMGLMRPQHQWNSVKPGEQLNGILSDPLHFVNVFGESIALRDGRWFSQFFGELGFSYIDVPAVSMLACLLAFAVSVGIGDRMNQATATFRRTLIVALTVAASVAMIYVTLYMSFTPVGYYMIDGVQGRYFVPLAIIGLAVLLRWMPLRLTDSDGKTPTRGPAITIVAATAVALIAALWKYYSIVWG
ncbi:DUF2142 domain-containing protein [Nocardia sp. KC 131]|uniref:DUF2142 domain-containing protein n=1 Tax=Nocardia arseniciresistens TaxID=3392119 RepID=UPI00398E829F